MSIRTDKRNRVGAVAVAILFVAAAVRPSGVLALAEGPRSYVGVSDLFSFRPGGGAGFGQDQLPNVILGPPLGGGATQGSLDVLSLGHGGEVVLGFGPGGICDGPGVDFIVFENAFRAGSAEGPVFAEVGILAAGADLERLVAFPYDAESFVGLAGITPVLSNPDNQIDPSDPSVAGGDGFDLAAIGLPRADYLRITDPGDAIADPGNRVPPGISGGFDLDAVAVVHRCEVLATPTPEASAATTPTATATARAASGDVNGDGVVDPTDADHLIREFFDGDGDRSGSVAGGEVFSTPEADANRDERITAGDLVPRSVGGLPAPRRARLAVRTGRRSGSARCSGSTTTEHIVVRARAESPAEQQAPTAFVTSIDVEPHADQLETVTDALAESVGVQVRRFGGLGAFSTVSIRGSSSNQVQIYLDGIPLSRARNETVNLADLPLDSLERIDVYRGTVPLAFGVGGIGGVVNLVTRPPSESSDSVVSTSYGSFDTRKVVASHSQSWRGVGLLAHATYLGSEGDFTFFNTSVEPNEGSPHQKRINNAFDSVSSLFKVGYEFDRHTQLDLTTDLFFKEQGVPGTGSRQLSKPSFTEFRSTSYARLSKVELVGGRVDFNAALFGTYLDEQFQDPDGNFGAGRQDRDDVSTQVGGNFGGVYRAPWRSELSWFGEVSSEKYDGYNSVRRPELRRDPTQTRLRVSGGLQDKTLLFGDRITVVPTIRYERIDDQGSEFSRAGLPIGFVDHHETLWNPAVGLQAAVFSWLDLRGNIGRAQRAPSFSELFGYRGSIQGNPNLKAEDGITRDIGVVARGRITDWWRKCRLEYAYFNNDIDDIIILQAIPGPNPLRATNVDSARVRGHELSLATAAWDLLEVDANYTHQDAENRGVPAYRGNQLPGRPRDELYVRVQVAPDPWQAYYEFNLVGQTYATQDNFERFEIDSRTIHTAGVRFAVREWLDLGFEARNLGNDRAEDAYTYPLPGRSFFGTVKLTLG